MSNTLYTSLLATLLGMQLLTNCNAASLQDIVREAVISNPEVLVAGSERDSVEQQMEQARGGFYPQADITVGTGWESTDNPTTQAAGFGTRTLSRDEVEITIRQLLFDGNSTLSEFRRQRARVNSRAYDTFSTAEVTGLKAIEAYLDVVNERKLVSLAEDNLDSHQQTYERIRKRSRRGVSSKADVQQSLGRLALARTNLLAQDNTRKDAVASFINIVGHGPVDLEEPESHNYQLPATVDDARDMALDYHPRLKSADADIDAAREQNAVAKALFSPRIHLEVRGSENDNLDGIRGSNSDVEVMFRGRYNFTGGRDTARRQETVYAMRQAAELRNSTRRQVIEGIQISWNAFETAKSQLEYFKIHADASKQALIAYRKQFSIGQRTLLDVLDQKNETFQANINYANAKNNLLFAEYRVLASIGRLLWALDVPLPDQVATIQ